MDQVNEAHARVNEMHGRLQVGGENWGTRCTGTCKWRGENRGGAQRTGGCTTTTTHIHTYTHTHIHTYTLMQAKQAEAVRSGLEDAAAAERIAIEAVQARIGALRQERERLTVARCVCGGEGGAGALRQERDRLTVERGGGCSCQVGVRPP